MNQCDVCEEVGLNDCINCYLGNQCLECVDYDKAKHICMSDGGCAEREKNETCGCGCAKRKRKV